MCEPTACFEVPEIVKKVGRAHPTTFSSNLLPTWRQKICNQMRNNQKEKSPEEKYIAMTFVFAIWILIPFK